MYEFENTLTKFFTENYFLPISAQGLSAFSVAGLSAVILVGRRSAVSLEGPSEIEIKNISPQLNTPMYHLPELQGRQRVPQLNMLRCLFQRI